MQEVHIEQGCGPTFKRKRDDDETTERKVRIRKKCKHSDKNGTRCTKHAQGNTELCKAHGGGKRCSFVDDDSNKCGKSAQGSTELCAVHGGGKRCSFVDDDNNKCTKSAQGSTELCIAHGGGARCSFVDKANNKCTKSAQGSTELCAAHGGGTRCSFVDDDYKKCTKSAQGSTELCAGHGGGVRCTQDCCVLVVEGSIATIASGKHPEDGSPMCTYAMRCMVNDTSNKAEKKRLMKLFGFKKDLVLRGEHAFYHALCLLVPELQLSERVLDESVLKKQQGKQKSNEDLRPDYYHYFGHNKQCGFTLHGEYDETPAHEDCDDREVIIASAANVPPSRTYIFRVQGHHYSSREVCRRVSRGDHTYFILTDAGKTVVVETAKVVKERLKWISQGLAPDDASGRTQKVYVNFD
jgi:hypothetical protein